MRWASGSGSTGPTAPLGGPDTVASLLEDDRDYGQVTRDHPEKLILGVPYYGCKWKTRSGEPNTSVQEFINYPRLRDAIPQPLAGERGDARSRRRGIATGMERSGYRSGMTTSRACAEMRLGVGQ